MLRATRRLATVICVLAATAASTQITESAPRPHARTGYSIDSFQSPTKNIVCHLYRTPPVEIVCTTMNDGFITIVRSDGVLWRGYNHGRWLYQGGRTLPYGSSLTWGSLFRCDSYETGMVCTAHRNRNGFFLNRTSYSLFLGPKQTYRANQPPKRPSPAPTGNWCDTHTCIPNFPNGRGSITQCSDGTWSQSGGISGACSWHGGVAH